MARIPEIMLDGLRLHCYGHWSPNALIFRVSQNRPKEGHTLRLGEMRTRQTGKSANAWWLMK